MNFEDWWEEFKPEVNHLNNQASGPMIINADNSDNSDNSAGRAFNTRGAEGEYVRKLFDREPGRVWSLVDTDGVQTITNGLRTVNLEAYYVTKKSFAGEFLEVAVSDLTEKYAVIVDNEDIFDANFNSLDDALVAGVMLSLHHYRDDDCEIKIVRLMFDDGEQVGSDDEVVSTIQDAYCDFTDHDIGMDTDDWAISTQRNATADTYLDWLTKKSYEKYKEIGIEAARLHISFSDSVKLGIAQINDIDSWVDRWKKGDGNGKNINLYLGLSSKQYAHWQEEPTNLSDIIFEKYGGKPAKPGK